MSDTREDILERLVSVVSSVAGIVTAARNKMQISELARPAAIVLDGGEETQTGYATGRGSRAPLIVRMIPEVWFFSSGAPEDIGPSIAAYRAEIVRAVLEDETLRGLCHDDDLRYEGCATRFTSGAQIEADLIMTFGFRYVLRSSDL